MTPLQNQPPLTFFQNPIRSARRETAALAGMLLATSALTIAIDTAVYFFRPFGKLVLVWLFTSLGRISPTDAGLLAESLMTSTVGSTFYSMALELVGFFLPFVLYAKAVRHFSFDQAFPFCTGRKLGHFPSVYACQTLVATGAVTLCNAVGNVIAPAFFAGFPTEEVGSLSASELVISFLSLCVFTPFVEEYVFRGVIFGSLRRYGFGYAAVASALLFGLAHAGPTSLVYAAASGLVFAAVYEMTGNVRYGVLLHALNNTVSFVFTSLLPQFADDAFIETANSVYFLLVGVLAFWGFAHLLQSLATERGESGQEAAKPEAEPQPTTEQATKQAIEPTTEPTTPKTAVPLRAFFSVGTVFYIFWFLYNMMSIYAYGY